jgi:hypothetical protein
MTLLHGTMTGAEVDALRIPLKKKLTAISDLPGHIVAFRGTLGRLATVGQAPLALDVYHWFLATLSLFPVFQQYTLLFTVANGAIAQQTFEAYAAYVLPQLHNILAHLNPRPFARNLEGHEDGADEDMMTGDLLYPNPMYPNPLYSHQLCPTTLVPYPILLPYSQWRLPAATITPTPWPWFFTSPTLPHGQCNVPLPACPSPCTCPRIIRQSRHKTERQETRQTRQQDTAEREDGHT